MGATVNNLGVREGERGYKKAMLLGRGQNAGACLTTFVLEQRL